jgi:hypothetical protein
MSRKVNVDVKVRLVIEVEKGQDLAEVMDELEYDFNDTTGNATVEDNSILDYDVVEG